MTEAERVKHAADKLADLLTGRVPLKAKPAPEPPPKPVFPARGLRRDWTPTGFILD